MVGLATVSSMIIIATRRVATVSSMIIASVATRRVVVVVVVVVGRIDRPYERVRVNHELLAAPRAAQGPTHAVAPPVRPKNPVPSHLRPAMLRVLALAPVRLALAYARHPFSWGFGVGLGVVGLGVVGRGLGVGLGVGLGGRRGPLREALGRGLGVGLGVGRGVGLCVRLKF